jgi:L,D-peptidoglycan transpeptidase YkuD (ErfK/YbiS/YcfS/YnhG family)
MKVRTSLKSQPIWMRWGMPGLSALLGILVLLGASGVWLRLEEGQDVLTQVPQWASGAKFDGDQNVSELPWKTIYTPETLSVDAVTLDLLHVDSQPYPKPESHQRPVNNDSGEALFLKTYQLLSGGYFSQALQTAQFMAEQYPHFQLGQLLYADLLSGGAGLVPETDALVDSPNLQHRMDQLKTEALLRTRHAGRKLLDGKIPAQLKFLSPSVRKLVVVDANKSRLYVLAYQTDDSGIEKLQVVLDVYISIGSQGMGKWREGDAKTPIGVYFIQKHLTDPMLPDLYGSGALTLDYPNPVDKQLKRTGSGIWLHGSPSQQYARPPTATDGCVVLANDDMTRLIQLGVHKDTPVIIAESLSWIDGRASTLLAPSTAKAGWPTPAHMHETSSDWMLVSAIEWVDQTEKRTYAVLSHELQVPGRSPQRRHSYWVNDRQQWKEVSNPL